MIDPEIFWRAADRIEIGAYTFTCLAIKEESKNRNELNLWIKCHSDGQEGFWLAEWIAYSGEFCWGHSEKNLRLFRVTLLREMYLNLVEQGYAL